ncbi:hypothetical protein AX16_000772 [Volvariella volvacea WC 439]|nr:hypothetical protein AX16_000772 [Volvariella volvacea WC 439]
MDFDFRLQDTTSSMDVDDERFGFSQGMGMDYVQWQSSQSSTTVEKLIRQSSCQQIRPLSGSESFSLCSSTGSSGTPSLSEATSSTPPSSSVHSNSTSSARLSSRRVLSSSRSRLSIGGGRPDSSARALRSSTSALPEDDTKRVSADNATASILHANNPTLFLSVIKGVSEKLDEKLTTGRRSGHPVAGNRTPVAKASGSSNVSRRKSKDHGALSSSSQLRKSTGGTKASTKENEKMIDSDLEGITQPRTRRKRVKDSVEMTSSARVDSSGKMDVDEEGLARQSRKAQMAPPPVPSHRISRYGEDREATNVTLRADGHISTDYRDDREQGSSPEVPLRPLVRLSHDQAIFPSVASVVEPKKTPSQTQVSRSSVAAVSSSDSSLRSAKLQRSISTGVPLSSDGDVATLKPSQPVQPPASIPAPTPAPPRTSQGPPPPLGMRRAHTMPNAKKPAETSLPTKQKGFKPPLLSNSQPISSTSTSGAATGKKMATTIGHGPPPVAGASDIKARKASNGSIEGCSPASTPPSSFTSNTSNSAGKAKYATSKGNERQGQSTRYKSSKDMVWQAKISSEAKQDTHSEDDSDDDALIPKLRRSPSPASSCYGDISFDMDALEETMQMYD